MGSVYETSLYSAAYDYQGYSKLTIMQQISWGATYDS